MSNELINRQYVGARYVPKIMGEWDKTLQYEPLCIVTYKNNSFTSKIPVPANIDITNENYWVNTGNYNAQIEEYRQDVVKVTNDVVKVTNDVVKVTNDVVKVTNDVVKVTNDLADEITNRENADNTLQENINSSKDVYKTEIVLFGDSWVDYTHDPSNVRIPQILKSCTGMNVHNYSYGGTGFIVDKGYMQQIDDFVDDASFNHNKISACILVAGLNEYNPMTSKETFTEYLQNWVDKLREHTDAPIYWFFDYSMVNELRSGGFNTDFYDQLDYYNYIATNVHRKICCQNMQGWVRFEENSNYWNTANYYHPNAYGSTEVGYNMAKVIMGLTPTLYQYCYARATWENSASALSRMDINYYIKNDRLYAYISCPIAASGTSTPSETEFELTYTHNKPAGLTENTIITPAIMTTGLGTKVYFYDKDKVYGKLVSGNIITSSIMCVRQ